MTKTIDKAGFDEWLLRQFEGSHNARRDILSRAQRGSEYIDLRIEMSDDEFKFYLTQSLSGAGLSRSVQSQVKRAAVLYRQYLRSTGKL